MKRFRYSPAVFASVLLLCSLLRAQQAAVSTSAAAVVPRLVNFSGKAVDQGKTITGITGVTFSIYSEETGGSPLWMETQNVQADSRGNYTAQLGATKTEGLPQELFTSGEARWLGVRVNGGEEQPRALETAGGIFRALPQLGSGAFAVVNGDVYTDFPFETLRLGLDRDAHLVLATNPPQHPEGDFGLEQGLATPAAASRYTFSGIAVYRAAFFADCSDGVFPLKPLLLRSMAAKRCSAQLYTGIWEDVGTLQRLQALNA